MTAADFVLLRVRTLEAERDALAESHTALIKALDSVLSNGYDIPGTDEIPGGDWGITAETKTEAQAVLTEARKLEAKA